MHRHEHICQPSLRQHGPLVCYNCRTASSLFLPMLIFHIYPSAEINTGILTACTHTAPKVRQHRKNVCGVLKYLKRIAEKVSERNVKGVRFVLHNLKI